MIFSPMIKQDIANKAVMVNILLILHQIDAFKFVHKHRIFTATITNAYKTVQMIIIEIFLLVSVFYNVLFSLCFMQIIALIHVFKNVQVNKISLLIIKHKNVFYFVQMAHLLKGQQEPVCRVVLIN